MMGATQVVVLLRLVRVTQEGVLTKKLAMLIFLVCELGGLKIDVS